MIAAVDLQTIAMDRLAYQYRNSPNLIAVITSFINQVDEVQTAFMQLDNLRRIDDAEGDGLDGIGEIVGQPRELSGVVPVAFFGYRDIAVGAGPSEFGDLTNPSVGFRYRSINELTANNKLLGDAEYRPLLKAKILRNQTEATPEDIISSIQAVLLDVPSVPVHLTFGPSTVTAAVQRTLSSEELAILNAKAGIRGEIPVIPRSVGINLTVVGI